MKTLLPTQRKANGFWNFSILLLLILFGQITFAQTNQSTITISTSATSGGAFSGTAPNRVFTPSATTVNIQASALVTELLTNNVTINTSFAGGTGTGNVTFSTVVTAASTSTTQKTFTINAGGSITVSNAINLTPSNAGGSNNTGRPGTNISFTAGTSISIAAAITATANIRGNDVGAAAGSVTLTAGTNVSITAAITANGTNGGGVGDAGGNGGAVSITGPTGITLTANISSTGGNRGGGTANGGNGGNITINDGDTTVTTGGVNDGQTVASIITANGGTGTVNGTNGTITKSGSGTFVMAGSNTYTGLTTVSAGTLKLGANGGATNTPLGTTGAGTSVTSGAVLDLAGFTLGTAEALTLNGTGLTASPAGALTNTGGNASYSGAITLASASTITATASGTLTSSGTVTGAFGLTLDGATGSTGTLSGVISTVTSLTKNGAGTMILSGTNTYTGATNVTVGVLNIRNNQGTGTTAGGVTVSLGAALQVQGGITVGAEALSLNGTGISSDGALRSVGTGNLTNTWGGTITLASTPVRINADASSTLSMGAITGTNTSLFLGGLGNIVVTGAITTGTGSMTDDGPGSVTFSGTNTYSGATTIAAGITNLGANNVFANNSSLVLNGGTFRTGTSTGFSDTMGTLTLSANSTFALGGTAHTMTFADSHLVSWAGTVLTINGWTGTGGSSGTAGKIVVGTTNAGLTSGQLATFSFTGYAPGAVQLSNGEVVPTPAPVITSATTASSTYGSANSYNITASNAPTSYNATGLPTGITVNTSTGLISVAATTAAGVYSITIFATNASGTGSTTLTYTVNAAVLTVTANTATRVYGSPLTPGAGATPLSVTGMQNSETLGGTITLAYTSGNTASSSVGNYIGAVSPSLFVKTSGTATLSNYTITYVTNDLSVTTAPLTITANNDTKVYGTTQSTPVSGATAFGSTGLQNGETIGSVTLTYGAGALAATDAVGSTSTITPSAATGGTFTASNYNITYTPDSGTLTVTAAPLTITADDGSKTYGQTYTVGAGSTAFTSSGLQNGETIGSITIASTGAVNTAAVGSYNIVPSAATGGTFTASNYSITYTNGTLTVNAAALTITADNGTKVYGTTQSTPVTGATTFGSTGLQNGETIGSVTLTYGAGAIAATDAVGSTSTITPSAATGGTFTTSNYSITYTPNSGTLTVTAAPLTITADNGTKVYGTTQSTPVTGATTFGSTGLQNGESIGTVTLTYGSGALAATDAVGSTSTITPSAATGGTFTASNYNITYTPNSGTLTVVTAPLTINADNAAKCFGTTYTLGSSAFSSIGLQNSETIGSVTLNSSGAISSAAAGSYSIVPSAATGGTFTASNYSITYVDGTLTVNALPSAPTGTDGERCSTGTVDLSTSVSGGETVDWYDASSGGTLLLSDSTTYTTASISSTTIYYAEARNTTTGCISSTRTAVTATVYPTSVGGTVSSDQTICSGTQPADLTLAGNTGAVVKWQSSTDIGFTSPTDISNTSTTLTGAVIGNLTANTYFRAVVQSGICSSANSSPILITIDAVSVGGTVLANQTICYGTEPANLTLSGNTGSVIKWQSSNDAGFTSPTDIAETSNTLDGITIGPLTSSTYFRAVVQNGVCSEAYSASVLISIDALTVGGSVSADQTICSGTQPSDLTVSGHTGSVIKWESSLDGVFTSPSDILVTSTTLTGATIGNLTQNTYFRAVIQNGSCDVEESDAVLITVNEESDGGSVDGGSFICSGSTSGLLTLTGYTGDIIRWEYSVSPFTSWTTIANTADTYTSGALTQTTQFRAVIQSGVCPEAYSSATSVEINTTTWSSGAWSNGTPDGSIITEAVIASSYTSAGENISACSLTVNNGATVVISSGDTVTLSGSLTAISGSFVTFNNNANLIQSGSANTNSGSVIIKRDSSPIYRLDYTLWSSPVANQNIKAFSPGTLDNRFYTHDTATNTYVTIPSPSTSNFATAKGYLIRVQNSYPAFVPPVFPAPQVPGGYIWTGSFAGVPNNGDYNFTLVDGGAANLRFNLVGNPYPSPIDATAFVSNPTNFANTTATIYLLRKTNYYSARPSYSTWTTAGYTDNGEPGRTLADWNGYLQTGQGFFVEASGTGTSLVFDNSMRVDNHDNQFFRNSHTPSTTSIERNRIWLNVTNPSGVFSQTMVGYITNATQGVDATIDGKYFNDGEVILSSLINDVPYAVQGRPVPFDTADVVPLYFKVSTAGNYTIAIDHVDGLFTGATQSIYLKDNLTTAIHDLNAGAYSFASDAGTFANRFEIIYSLPLGTVKPIFTADNVIIYSHNNEFVVNTGNTIMSSVKVFDIRGRLLQEKKAIDASQTTIGNGLANQVLLVQITSADGVVITKKVIR